MRLRRRRREVEPTHLTCVAVVDGFRVYARDGVLNAMFAAEPGDITIDGRKVTPAELQRGWIVAGEREDLE